MSDSARKRESTQDSAGRAAVMAYGPRRRLWRFLCDRAVLLSFACSFAVHLVRWEGPVTGYWDTYIAAPALHLQGQAAGFYLNDGSPAYPQTQLIGRLPDDLVDRRPGGFGVISEDQRLGAALIASPFYRAFALFGFRAVHAFAWAIATGLVTATALATGAPAWAAFIAGLFMALNPYALSVNRLNANVVALPALAAILWLLFALPQAIGRTMPRSRSAPMTAVDPAVRYGWAALIGLLLGVLGGVRNECVLVLPAVALAMWSAISQPAQRLWVFAATTLGGLLSLAPALAWQRWAFGRMIIHASQFEGFEGFRPTFPHSLGPLHFDFNGLLNWPFHDHLIRTPHFPYPTYALLPLVIVRSFGVLGVALFAIGWARLWRRQRMLAVCTGLWIAALWAMLSVQENWEELKMTYLVLLFPPAALAFAEGLGWLFSRTEAPRRWLLRCGSLAAVVVVVWVGARAIGAVQVPVDERWWQRFPHAAVNRAGFAELPHELRWSWEFFHSSESPAELQRERARLIPPGLLPRLYRHDRLPLGAAFRQMRSELGTPELRTLAIWKYIYSPP